MRERDIRQTLRRYLAMINKAPNTAIIDEFGVCQGRARVDMAVVNGTLQGYEIKSEDDTLSRLPLQADFYSKVFNTVTLVVASKHLRVVRTMVPKWWGLWEACKSSSGVVLRKARRRRPNPDPDPVSVAQLLWKDEILDILVGLGADAGCKSKPKRWLWSYLASIISPRQLGDMVRQRLKRRASQQSAYSQV